MITYAFLCWLNSLSIIFSRSIHSAGNDNISLFLWLSNIPWKPTQVILPGNPMDRRVWWATVHGVTRVEHDLVTQQQHSIIYVCVYIYIYIYIYRYAYIPQPLSQLSLDEFYLLCTTIIITNCMVIIEVSRLHFPWVHALPQRRSFQKQVRPLPSQGACVGVHSSA